MVRFSFRLVTRMRVLTRCDSQSKRAEMITRVHLLAGPLRGESSVAAPHILPYNPETAEAIKKTGQLVYWEKGTV